MRQKAGMILFWLLCFLFMLGISHRAEAAYYNTEWIGSEAKTYEMAWVQAQGARPNGQKYQFTFKQHFRIDGVQRIPIYCIDYYKEGPTADQKYAEKTLPAQNLPQKVKQGFCNILRNGYPNVDRPYGTVDDAEAYYATGAAMHIWAMYHGIDKEGAERLGWFSPQDGFSMTRRDLRIYQGARTTGTTSKGTHILTTNPNPSSRRTWFAAMQLLIDALEEPAVGQIRLTTARDFHIQGQYFQWTVQLEQENCSSWKIVGEGLPEGTVITPASGTEKSRIIECRVPVNRMTSGKKVTLKAEAVVPGGNLEDSYVLSDSSDPSYQRMFMLRYRDSRRIVSAKVSDVTGDCTGTVEYDLNYSGANYIRRGNGNLYNHQKILFFRAGSGCTVTASAYPGDRESAYTVSDRSAASKNLYSAVLNTDANGSRDAGYPNETLYTTFRFAAKAKQDITLKLWWEGSSDPVHVTIKGGDSFSRYNVLLPKKPEYGSELYMYFKSPDAVTFKSMQVTEGDWEEQLENAPAGDPKTSGHCIGEKYGTLYGGRTPARAGYTFLGWNTKKNGTGVFITGQSTVTDPHRILYAVWEKNPGGKVYYHYKNHGGTALRMDNGAVYTGEDDACVISLSEGEAIPTSYKAERPGWTFSGWTLKKDLARYAPDPAGMIMGTEDVHLYANFGKNVHLYFHYLDPKTGKETTYTDGTLWCYNGNPPDKMAYTPACGKRTGNGYAIPSVPGYAFSGWSMERKGSAVLKGNQPVAPVEDTHYYAIYTRPITVKFADDRNESVREHESDRYHAVEEGAVSLTADGTLLPAKIRVPDEPCTAEGWEFWGWSLAAKTPVSMDIFPEMGGQTVDVADSAVYYGFTRKKVTIEFFDWSPAAGAHREYAAENYSVKDAYGKIEVGKTQVPYLCREAGWASRGWSSEEGGESSVQLKEGQWIEAAKDARYYGSRRREASVTFYHGKEQYTGDRWRLKKTMLSQTAGDIFQNWKGQVTGKTVVVPRPFDGSDWSHMEGMESWESSGYTSAETVSGEPAIQCVPGEVLQLKGQEVYYAVYQRLLKIRYFDLDEQGEPHTHKEETATAYMGCQGICFPAAHIVDTPCLSKGNTFYGWEQKHAGTGSTVYYPVQPETKCTLAEDTDFTGVYDPQYQPVLPTDGPLPTPAPEPELPDRFVRSISTAYLYTLLPGSKWRPGAPSEEDGAGAEAVAPYELLKSSLEKGPYEYEYRWVLTPDQVRRAGKLLEGGLPRQEEGAFSELLKECEAVSGS